MIFTKWICKTNNSVFLITKMLERILDFREFTEDDYREIGINFSKNAAKNSMTVQTCFEDRNLI